MFLELRHLKTIRAIEQTGSLAAAAERLHLTQSALSHQIRALETYYETPLFSRRYWSISAVISGFSPVM